MFENELDLGGLSRRGRRRKFREQQRRREVNPVHVCLNLSTETSRMPSSALWADCPEDSIVKGLRSGIRVWEDFTSQDNEDGNDNAWERYIDTSDTIRNLVVDTTALATGSRGGVLRLLTAATDNNAPVIQYQTANGTAPFLIGNTSGADWKLWFEARIRKSTIADDGLAFAIGLAQVNRAADDGLLADNTGDIVDSISFIGFRNLHDNGEELDFVYQDAAQTAPTEVIAAISDGTLVASTWVKVGFLYDPKGPSSKKIKIFVNNKEQSTYVTTTNIDAATFPENDALSPVFGVKNGTAAVASGDIDWLKCVQVYD